MLAKLAYWAAVIVVSLALLVALIVFFESRDDSALGQAGAALPSDGVAAATASGA